MSKRLQTLGPKMTVWSFVQTPYITHTYKRLDRSYISVDRVQTVCTYAQSVGPLGAPTPWSILAADQTLLTPDDLLLVMEGAFDLAPLHFALPNEAPHLALSLPPIHIEGKAQVVYQLEAGDGAVPLY